MCAYKTRFIANFLIIAFLLVSGLATLTYGQMTTQTCETCGMMVAPDAQTHLKAVDSTGTTHYVDCLRCALKLLKTYDEINITTNCDWNGPAYVITINLKDYVNTTNVTPSSALFIDGGCTKNRVIYNQGAADALIANNGTSQYLTMMQNVTIPANATIMTIDQAAIKYGFISSPDPTPTPTVSPSPSPTPAPPTTVVFNFDNATPTLTQGISTPIDQTSNAVTAHFSSPSDFPSHPAFSVQNLNSLAAISTVINSNKFSGFFLWPSTINRDRLDINFSQSITSISFVFKTAELHDPGPGGTGSPIRLTAYMNSLSSPVGPPVTVNGIETPFDNYPEGTLTFNSGGQPFNLVEIDLPYISAERATGFIIDNITVITA